jgi:hypothetical protein
MSFLDKEVIWRDATIKRSRRSFCSGIRDKSIFNEWFLKTK